VAPSGAEPRAGPFHPAGARQGSVYRTVRASVRPNIRRTFRRTSAERSGEVRGPRPVPVPSKRKEEEPPVVPRQRGTASCLYGPKNASLPESLTPIFAVFAGAFDLLGFGAAGRGLLALDGVGSARYSEPVDERGFWLHSVGPASRSCSMRAVLGGVPGYGERPPGFWIPRRVAR
jgi:hypothetical protein